jgi:hypothetical protein
MDIEIGCDIGCYNFKIVFGDILNGGRWIITAYLRHTHIKYTSDIRTNKPPSMSNTQLANTITQCAQNHMFTLSFKDSDRNILLLTITYDKLCDKKIIHVIELINDGPPLNLWMEYRGFDKLTT